MISVTTVTNHDYCERIAAVGDRASTALRILSRVEAREAMMGGKLPPSFDRACAALAQYSVGRTPGYPTEELWADYRDRSRPWRTRTGIYAAIVAGNVLDSPGPSEQQLREIARNHAELCRPVV